MSEIRVTVRVRPGSSRTRVGGAYGDDRQLVVAVGAQPVDGAANAAVIRALAEALGLRPRAVSVVSGHTARTKVLQVSVDDADEDGVRVILEGLLAGAAP